MKRILHIKKHSIQRWILLSFLTIMLLAMAASALMNYFEAINHATQQGQEYATFCADNLTHLLRNTYEFDSLLETDESETYANAKDAMDHLCKSYKLDYIYVYTIDMDVPSRYYIICSAVDPEVDAMIQKDYSRHHVPAKEIFEGEKAILSGAMYLQEENVDNSFGHEATWFAPYIDNNGQFRAVIGLDYNYSQIQETIRHHFLVDMIPFSLSFIAGLLILLIMVQRRIVSPIGAISDSMRIFAQDSHIKPEPLKIHFQDEIGEIASVYEKMTGDISEYVNNIETLTREQVETNVQLDLARRIQNGLVPERTSLAGKGFSIYAMTRPAKAVGGDFYDCFQRDDNKICFFMGDVSGKGITAAIYMAMLKTVTREKLIAGLCPADALNQTNDLLCAQNPENLFATAFAAVLDPDTGLMTYANAGHTYPVIIKDEPELLIPDPGIPLGLFEDSGLTDQTMMLPPGQGIMLYTDGVTEAVNPADEFFGDKRLLESLKGLKADKNDPEKIILRVSRSVCDFYAGGEPFDDMAALVLINPLPDSDWKDIPVAQSSFDEVKAAVFNVIGENPRSRHILLACDETLTNIVSYSGAHSISFLCEKQADLLCVTFSDDGIPFDPTTAKEEEKDLESLDSGGMGINIIRQTVSSMNYERKNGRNVFTLSFDL